MMKVNIQLKHILPYLLLLPSLIVSICFFLLPFILLFIVSLTNRASFFFAPEWTALNYYKAVTRYSPDFYNTLLLSGLGATLDIIIGYPFAYLMSRRIRRFNDAFRSFLLIPLLGELYIAYGLWWLFLPTGPLAPILEFFGFSAIQLLYSPIAAAFALTIYTFPFAVMQMGVNLSQIDPILEEAAMCLGAGTLQRFFRVVIPLSLPGILSGWLMSFGWNIGAYAIPFLMGGVVLGHRILSVQIRSIALLMMNYGLAAALATVLVLISSALMYISLKITKGALI